MLVIQIILGLAALAGFIWGFLKFNSHCESKFGYKFFTQTSFIIIGVSALLLYIGNEWRLNSIQENGDVLNGIVVMIIGAIAAIYLTFMNFKNTNIVYGIGGSAIQFALFCVLAYIGIFVLMIGLALSFFAAFFGADRVYVVNK